MLLQWDLLLVKCDHLSEDSIDTKQSPSSTRPHSDASSVLIPAMTPVSIAVSETSAFTGVIPNLATPLHQHDDVMTTPTSSISGSYFSEDDLTDSPLHRHHGNKNGYCNNNESTISFAQRHHAQHRSPSKCRRPLLVTADVHHVPEGSATSKNVPNSSCIMTPVNEGTATPTLLRAGQQEEIDSTLLDSWNEAELMVPSSPEVLMDSDHHSDVLSSRGRVGSSSYKETSPMVVRVKPQRPSNNEGKLTFKPVKGKNVMTRKKRRSHQLQADTSDSSASDVIPPASVATAPGLKPWQSNTKKVNNPVVTLPTVLQSSDPLVTMTTTGQTSDMVTRAMEQSSSSILATSDNCVVIEEHFTLPLSNSPIDIIIMLSRMAALCCSLTKVLSPKLPVAASLPAAGNVYTSSS